MGFFLGPPINGKFDADVSHRKITFNPDARRSRLSLLKKAERLIAIFAKIGPREIAQRLSLRTN
jgi:hypothetical protein